jgi:tetratricopeptide (TPR) repeat protein
MSGDYRANKIAQSKNERDILELRIDTKLAEAQADLERLARAKHEPKLKRVLTSSGIIIAALIVSNLWAWLGMKNRIANEAGRIIDTKLIDPQLAITLDEALSKKAVPFISAQVRPIETNVAALKTNVEAQKSLFATMALDVSNKQSQLAERQKSIDDQQHIQELLVKAKAGSLAAYLELRSLSSVTNNILAETAMAASTEINLFLDAYRFRSYSQRQFEDFSGKSVRVPLDAIVIGDLNSQLWSQRETAVEAIAQAKKLNTIPHLCERLNIESNLFVVADITKALSTITGEYFEALDIKAVNNWWEANKNASKYQSPYRNLQNLNSEQSGGIVIFIPPKAAEKAIKPLTEVLTAEPSAWWTRCLLGSCYAFTGDTNNAEKQLSAVEAGFPDYAVLYFDKSLMFLFQGRTNEVVESLNKTLELSPSLGKYIRFAFPTTIVSDPRIRWPDTNK